MAQRRQDPGWDEAQVIDEALGRSAAGTAERTRFQPVVSEVCLGNVGVVAAREVSLFARTRRDRQ